MINENILTNNGYIESKQISQLHKIYGADGIQYNIIDMFVKNENIYKITFTDDTHVYYSENDSLDVITKTQRTFNNQNSSHKYSKKIIKDIKGSYIEDVNPSKKYSIDTISPIEFSNNINHSIEPYLLGLLLGDGYIKSKTITFTNSEDDLLDYVKNIAISYSVRHYENHKAIVIHNKDNNIREDLKSMKLHGCGSREKFIPYEYLNSNITSRIDMLSGLVNTDGFVGDGSIVYSTYSNRLYKDVSYLARSLGFMVLSSCRDRTNEFSSKKYKNEIEYTVRILGYFDNLKLSKKHISKLCERKYPPSKLISKIENIGMDDILKLKTNNPNKNYVVDDFTIKNSI